MAVSPENSRCHNDFTLLGGKGSADKLIAADQANAWNISAANAGTVNGVSFRNMENLTGGSQDDTFRISDGQGVRGKIDGGGGQDELDYRSYLSKPVLVNLQAKTATSLGGFLNLEMFHGGSGMSDSLIGANKANNWILTGRGTGNVAGTGFDGFENFTGGSLVDNFTLAATGDWLGTLTGGSGSDLLVAFPGINQWIILGSGGTLNGRKFTGIEVRR